MNCSSCSLRAEGNAGLLPNPRHAGKSTADAPVQRKRIIPGAVVAFLLTALPFCAWSFNANQDIVVHVQKDGSHISVDVDCPVEAPRWVVWEVLTDYDHMAQFVSNLEYSGVAGRQGNLLRVHQTGKASRGPLTLTFDNIREVELMPFHEIRSRLISGDFKSYDFVTRIVEDAAQVHIINRGRYTPNIWVPPYIGPALIELETQKQFGEIRAEILRRNSTIHPPT